MDSEPKNRPRPDETPEEVDEVDENSIESFPASDAPSFTPVTHPGEPNHAPKRARPTEDHQPGASQ